MPLEHAATSAIILHALPGVVNCESSQNLTLGYSPERDVLKIYTQNMASSIETTPLPVPH